MKGLPRPYESVWVWSVVKTAGYLLLLPHQGARFIPHQNYVYIHGNEVTDCSMMKHPGAYTQSFLEMEGNYF